MQGSFAPQFTRPNALDDPMVQVARVVAVSVVSPSRGESFVGCCGYMVRANAPIGSEIRSRRGAIGYVTAGLSFNPAMRCSTTSRQALHLRSAARPYMESKVDDFFVTESRPLHSSQRTNARMSLDVSVGPEAVVSCIVAGQGMEHGRGRATLPALLNKVRPHEEWRD